MNDDWVAAAAFFACGIAMFICIAFVARGCQEASLECVKIGGQWDVGAGACIQKTGPNK
jgi:hypothetical protein